MKRHRKEWRKQRPGRWPGQEQIAGPEGLAASSVAAGPPGYFRPPFYPGQSDEFYPTGAEAYAEAYREIYGRAAYGPGAYDAEAYGAEGFGAEAFGAEAFGADAFGAEAFSAEAFGAETSGAEAYSAGRYGAQAYGADAYAEAYITPPQAPPGILLPKDLESGEWDDDDLQFMLPKEIHEDLMLHDDANGTTRTPSDDAHEATCTPPACSPELIPVPMWCLDKPSPAIASRVLSCKVPELVRRAEKGDLEAVCKLLEQGADPSSKDDFDLTPLHGAAKKGHAKVVALLLEWRAQVNAQASALHGETPLHYACKYGHTATAQLLLDNGAHLTAVTTEGRTAWHSAQEKQHMETADLLAETAATVSGDMSATVAEFLDRRDGSIMRLHV